MQNPTKVVTSQHAAGPWSAWVCRGCPPPLRARRARGVRRVPSSGKGRFQPHRFVPRFAALCHGLGRTHHPARHATCNGPVTVGPRFMALLPRHHLPGQEKAQVGRRMLQFLVDLSPSVWCRGCFRSCRPGIRAEHDRVCRTMASYLTVIVVINRPGLTSAGQPPWLRFCLHASG